MRARRFMPAQPVAMRVLDPLHIGKGEAGGIALPPRLGSSSMHVLRVVRVLLPLLIVAALVGAASSVLSARPDLQKAKRNVDASWTSVSGQLDNRYVLLAKVDDNLRPVPGPMHAIVTDLDTALAHWRAVHLHSSVATQVNAANDVEALARRLLLTEKTSPRVQGNATILNAIRDYDVVSSMTAATAFNQRVARLRLTVRSSQLRQVCLQL